MYRRVLALLTMVLAVQTASAQSRMIVSGALGTVEVSLESGATRPLGRPSGAVGGVPIYGGRYLVTASHQPSGALVIEAWAPRTGETVTIASLPSVPGDGEPSIVGDTTRPRAFVWNQQTISVITPAGVRAFINGINPTGSIKLMAYSPLSQTLFVVRHGAEIELAQYDADGTLIRLIPLPAGHVPLAVASTSDGADVFLVTIPPPLPNRSQVRRYDASTGAEVAVADLDLDSIFSVTTIAVDEANRRLLFPSLAALEVRTFDLRPVNLFRYPGVLTCRFDVGVDERTGTVLAATTGIPYPFVPYSRIPTVTALNVVSGASLGSVALTNPSPDSVVGSVAPCGGGSVVLTAPLPPIMEPPSVTGGSVTLAWQPMRNTIDYQVEASVGAAAPIFTARTGGHTSMTVSNVPSGSYTVRVRGVNDSGVGSPSQPVVVPVP